MELFWSVFPRIRTEHEGILRICPYSVRMQEKTDQKNFEYGHFLRSCSLDFVNNFYQYFCKRDISKNETVLKSEFLNTLYNQIFDTAQNLEFSIKNFISKCDQICRKLRVWSHLLKKSLMENFTFRAASGSFCLGGRIRANSVHTRIKHKSSRHLEVYYKKVFYKDFSKITGKHLCRSFFFNKSSGLTSVTLLEKRL